MNCRRKDDESVQKKRSFLVLWIVLCIVICLLMLFFVLPMPTRNDIGILRTKLAEDGRIIHAGGFLKTQEGKIVTYTNSLDAINNLYEKGYRFCEIDLQETSDGIIICGHGDEGGLVYGTGLPHNATGKEFMNSRIHGEFTPMTLPDLAGFMETHPELFVITDVKTDNIKVCGRIAEEYPDLQNRFIVQIHLPEEYESITSLGFSYIMYPIFKTPDNQRDILSLAVFARQHDLVAMIVANGYYSPDLKLNLAAEIIGIPIILHTLNDEWEINYYLDHYLALAVYTDRTD